MANEMAEAAHFLRGTLHRRGVNAMNFRLLTQSLIFVAIGLILTAVLAMALRFEIARMLFAIGVAGIWLIAEIYVAIKVALGLWGWSSGLAGMTLRLLTARFGRKMAAIASRGDA
jgi:hypothetical protein